MISGTDEPLRERLMNRIFRAWAWLFDGRRHAFARGGVIPGWRADDDSIPAFLSLHRQITDPDEVEALGLTADAARMREAEWRDVLDLLDLIGDVPVRFWVCPAHSGGGPLRPTVVWAGDVAHCLSPGCPRRSDEPRTAP